MPSDNIPMPLTYEARDTKRGRYRAYVLDATKKTLMYSAGSFTSEADALAVGAAVTQEELKAKLAEADRRTGEMGATLKQARSALESEKRMHADDRARLTAMRADASWARSILKWVALCGFCVGVVVTCVAFQLTVIG